MQTTTVSSCLKSCQKFNIEKEMVRKLILIELNEINFDVVSFYTERGVPLPGFRKLIDYGLVHTEAESKYENLEPWIQWTTCFTGEPFKNHKIFRLGDGLKLKGTNIFTDFSKVLKKSCGAICPMNISSKDNNFDFFLPDPWSNENTIGELSLKLISQAINKGVNNNKSKKIDLFNQIKLLIGLAFNLRFKDFKKLLKYFFTINMHSFRKALFLDYILVLLHHNLIKKNKT